MPAAKTPRLYIDEDASNAGLLVGLRRAGIDVLSASEADNLRLSDEEQLAFATSVERTIDSFNVRDYVRLHTQWIHEGRAHAGIVLAAQGRMSIGEQVQALGRLSEPMSQQLVFLPAKSTML